MPTIELSEVHYQALEQKATEFGLATVEALIVALAENELDLTPDLDSLFTPEVMEQIEAADREIEEGHFYTMEEVVDSLREHKEAWLRAQEESALEVKVNGEYEASP